MSLKGLTSIHVIYVYLYTHIHICTYMYVCIYIYIYNILELPLTFFWGSFWFLGISGRFDVSSHCCAYLRVFCWFLRAFWRAFSGVLLDQDTCGKLRPFAAKTATKTKTTRKK